MRDLFLGPLLLAILVQTFRTPSAGVLGWAWLTLMTPQKLIWGFLSSMPLNLILAIATLLYAWQRTAFLGAILLTGYLGGAVATHLRVGSPLFGYTLFGVYLGIMLWGGLWLRDSRIRALLPLIR